MLKVMRSNTKVVIWIVVLSFVIWGGSSLVISTQSLSPYAGSVFGKKVKLREFEKRKKLLKFMLPSDFSSLPDEAITAETFRRIALSRGAKKSGMKVTDEEVRITTERLLGLQGPITIDGYRNWTRQNFGETPRDFEETLRDEILAQKMLMTLFNSNGLSEPQPDKKLSDEETKALNAKRLTVLNAFYSQAKFESYLKPPAPAQTQNS